MSCFFQSTVSAGVVVAICVDVSVAVCVDVCAGVCVDISGQCDAQSKPVQMIVTGYVRVSEC